MESKMIHKNAIDLVPTLRAIEDVLLSPLLSTAQKSAIVGEIHTALPDKMFCPNSRLTLSIITSIVRNNDGSAAQPEAQSTEAPKKPSKGKGSKSKPAGASTPNARGKSKVSPNAGKPKE
jgi:hypothetical protein